MTLPLSRMPLLPAAIAFAAGIACSSAASAESRLYIIGITVLAMCVLLILRRRMAAVLLAPAVAGMIALTLCRRSDDAAMLAGRHAHVEAIVKECHAANTTQSATLEISRATINGLEITEACGLPLHIDLPDFSREMEPGDEIRFAATIERPKSRVAVPYQFDYADHLLRSGIELSAFVIPDSLKAIIPAGEGASTSMAQRLVRQRQRLKDALLRAPVSTHTKEFLVTTLTGDATVMSPEMRADFRRAGLAHVLALSGLHVGVLCGTVLILLWPLRLLRLKWLAETSAIVFVWWFAAMTGFSASVTRATVMATMLLIASTAQRRHSSANALCLAAIMVLMVDPTALFTAGFQLSFAAVAGILLFARKLNPVSERCRLPYKAVSMLTVTLAAVLATSVITIYHFHSFPLCFAVANTMAAPLIPAAISCGAAMATFGMAGHYPGMLCRVTDALCGGITGISDMVAAWPMAVVDGIIPSVPALITITCAIAALAYAIHWPSRMSVASCAAFTTCALIICLALPAEADAETDIYVMPSSGYTAVIISGPDTLHAITTAQLTRFEEVSTHLKSQLADHMARRQQRHMKLHDCGQASGNGWHYAGRLLHAGGKTMLIVSRDSALSLAGGLHIDYLLVCRGFHGDLRSMIPTIRGGVDSVLLSADIDSRHRRRLALQAIGMAKGCRELTYPFAQPFLPAGVR